jgi:hypothetical protein
MPPCSGIAADGPVLQVRWFADGTDWCVETNPWSGGMRIPARGVTAAPCGRGEERRASPVCLAREQGHRHRQATAGPWGARETVCGAGCHAAFRTQAIDSSGCREEDRPEKLGGTLTACRQRCARGRRDCGAVWTLSTQIVGSTRRKYRRQPQCQTMAERSSTLAKEYERLPSLATAKQERRSAVLVLAHPPVHVNGA